MVDANRTRDSRSLSQDGGDDSESEYPHHADGNLDLSGSSIPGKPGRKKNPNSQAARRDQNRIAQREFRLRKQQRIRDLEARVEILSGSKDETFSELREILKDLMQENQTLRGLVRGLSGFIGDNVGGIIPKLGFDQPQEFIDYINKAETDTAFQGYQRRKKANSSTTQSPAPSISSVQKRSAEEVEDTPSMKRPKTGNGMGTLNVSQKDSIENDRYGSMLVPINPAPPPNTFYSSTGRAPNEIGLFTELLQGQNNGSAMFMTNSASDGSQAYGTGASASTAHSYASAYPSPGNQNVQPSFNSHSYMPNPAPPVQHPSADDVDDRPEDPKMPEAMKLIHYHLDNYKRNNAYCLPQSLRPTLVQRTVPHESVIDGVPHPELRDRMILLRGRFDLVDCLHEYHKSLTLHGDDVLAHNNWELSEDWLQRYGFLVDQPVLSVCNRWRRERGEPELGLADLPPQAEPSPN